MGIDDLEKLLGLSTDLATDQLLNWSIAALTLGIPLALWVGYYF
jgi:hypothetical protein